MTLNVKSTEGKHTFKRLAAESDVFVEGFRYGVMTRLGLDYEILNAINPRLNYCAVSGFGQDGPYKLVVGHDLNYMGTPIGTRCLGSDYFSLCGLDPTEVKHASDNSPITR